MSETAHPDQDPRDETWLAGGGEAGARLRSIDWSQSPLGPLATWPRTLQTTVGIMLPSRFAMRIVWGPQHIFLYNDAYAPILGSDKLEAAMGSRTNESFREVWDVVGPLFSRVLGGEAFALEDRLLPLSRNGYLEECYFTLSYSPLRDDDGRIGGILGVVAETTKRVVAERRLRTLREIAGSASAATSPSEVCALAAKSLSSSAEDVPFALFYVTDGDGRAARLVASCGLAHPAAMAAHVALTISDGHAWPLDPGGAKGGHRVVEDVASRFGDIVAGPYPEPVRAAVVLPLTGPRSAPPYGFFVAGVNPRRALDDAYLGFFELAREHVDAALAQAVARTQLEELVHTAESAARRLSRLHEMAAGLAAAVSPREVATVAVHVSRKASDADAAALWGIDATGALELLEATPPSALTHDHDLPIAQIMRSRRPCFVASRADHEERWGADANALRQLPAAIGAYAVVPLNAEDRAIGLFALAYKEPRTFGDEERSFALTLAGECAQALERARLYQAAKDAAERAERANSAKDEFLAIVSHELRNPLSAMLGWTRMLRSGGLPEDKRDRALETIERNAVNQSQLIEDLLDVSRIVSGKLRLDVQTVDFVQVIEAAIESARPAIDAKQIRLKTMLASVDADLSGDAARLQQVVWNLLANATKFTPKGGTIQVVLRRVESQLELCVNDDGQGISAAFLPQVFDRFKQADPSTTRQHGGLGLGLAISRNLVEAHGGTIAVTSEGAGKGSTFVVRLPVSTVRLSPRQTSSGGRKFEAVPFDAPEELVGLRVLAVDDEADARELVAVVLRRCGATVFSAGSAAEAMEQLASSRPDVLVSDIGMPGEDGYALIRRVRALSPGDGGMTPAACLTAYAGGDDRRRALAAGFTMHVPKPVEPTELIAVVANLARIAKAMK